MGPKKDLIGMWRKATLKAGLRFGVTTHLSRSYSWFNVANQSDTEGPMKGVPYDGAQGEPEGAGDAAVEADLGQPGFSAGDDLGVAEADDDDESAHGHGGGGHGWWRKNAHSNYRP